MVKSGEATYWAFYWQQWRGLPALFLWLLLLNLLSALASVLVPLFFRRLLDDLQVGLGHGDFAVWFYCQVILGIGLLRFVVSYYPHFRAYGNLMLESSLRQKYFAYLIRQSPDFFHKFRSGDLLTRLTEDLVGYPKVSWFGCSGLFRALNALSILVSCSAMMFWLHPTLALASLLPLPLALVLYFRLKGRLEQGFKRSQEAISKTANHMEMCFSGIRVLKACCNEERQVVRFRQELDDRLTADVNIMRLGIRMGLFYDFMGQFAQIVVVLLGGYLVLNQQLTIGTYFAFFSYLGMIIHPMLELPSLLVHSRQAFVSVGRLLELKSSDWIEDLAGSDSPFSHLELRDVCYSYPESSKDRPALAKVGFQVKAGERVAIVGRIGAGKSTLMNVLAGSIVPDSGKILLNSKEIDKSSLKTLRSRIGYVGQESVVLSGRVDENIRFMREYSQPAVEEAARQSQFLSDVSGFSEGFAQEIGQRGVSISGGQKQRLSIARALVTRPEILLLDDATASLDAANEENFWKELASENRQHTIVMVTHRKATARQADKVIMMDGGRILDMGTFAELMDRSNEFRTLFAEGR